MNRLIRHIIIMVLLLFSYTAYSQTDRKHKKYDSINVSVLQEYNRKLAEIEKQRIEDSIKKNRFRKSTNLSKNNGQFTEGRAT